MRSVLRLLIPIETRLITRRSCSSVTENEISFSYGWLRSFLYPADERYGDVLGVDRTRHRCLGVLLRSPACPLPSGFNVSETRLHILD
jgi:hypothetical protein